MAAQALTLFCLHYLGGSGREYAGVADRFGRAIHVLPLDLAGFGEARHTVEYSVTAMAQAVLGVIRATAAHRWMLVGHSMGAKVVTAVVAGIENHSTPMAGLVGVVLLAGSPPSPEPMDDEKRRTMQTWFGGDRASKISDARRYLEQNTSHPLPAYLLEQSIEDLLSMDPAAWNAWLTSGSREDWSARVGVLHTPTLLIAGADDVDLGAVAQRKLMMPHFSRSRLEVVDDATHLLPLENTRAVADLIREHAASLGE